jgi:hypothetical protein
MFYDKIMSENLYIKYLIIKIYNRKYLEYPCEFAPIYVQF